MRYGIVITILLLPSYTAAGERTLATPIALDHLEAPSFAEWVDGAEKPACVAESVGRILLRT